MDMVVGVDVSAEGMVASVERSMGCCCWDRRDCCCCLGRSSAATAAAVKQPNNP